MTPSTPPAIAPPPAPAPKKTRWLLYAGATFLALLLMIVATVFITIWWLQRPIKPVVLSAPEKAVVEQKLQQLGGANADAPTNRVGARSAASTARSAADAVENVTLDRHYEPGSKVFTLTEREINGLLNANTDLGNAVRLEFTRDAINAYLVVPIPKDFPIGGGKMFRARGRFSISLGQDAPPHAILEDVTVFGLSLPKAWMGGLKGENLISDAMGKRNGSPVFRGIKNLRIEPGALVLEVED